MHINSMFVPRIDLADYWGK